jgi:hypothetical protein
MTRRRSPLTCEWCKHVFRPSNGYLGTRFCSRHCARVFQHWDKRNPLPPKRADLHDIILP